MLTGCLPVAALPFLCLVLCPPLCMYVPRKHPSGLRPSPHTHRTHTAPPQEYDTSALGLGTVLDGHPQEDQVRCGEGDLGWV